MFTGTGAIVGSCGGTSSSPGCVINCHNVNTTVISNDYAAGIVGTSWEAKIEGCTNSGNVISTGRNSGGIAGHAHIMGGTEFNNCSNTGNVTGKNHVGGICGSTWDGGSNLYNSGEIKGETYVGGITADFGKRRHVE